MFVKGCMISMPTPEEAPPTNKCWYCGREHEEIEKELPRLKTIRSIVAATAKEFGFTVQEIKSNRRNSGLVRARHIAIYRVYKLLHCSYPELGEFFGRDHTTIMHAVRQVARRYGDACLTNPTLREGDSRTQ